MSQWFSLRCDTLVDRIKTIIYALPFTPVIAAVATPKWAPPPPAVVQIAILPMPAEQFLVDFMSPHILSVGSTPPLGLRPTHFTRDNPAALHVAWRTCARPPDISTDTMDERCRFPVRLRLPPSTTDVTPTAPFNYFESIRSQHFPPPISSLNYPPLPCVPLTTPFTDGYAPPLISPLTSLLINISLQPAPSLCNSRARLAYASIANYLACGLDPHPMPACTPLALLSAERCVHARPPDASFVDNYTDSTEPSRWEPLTRTPARALPHQPDPLLPCARFRAHASSRAIPSLLEPDRLAYPLRARVHLNPKPPSRAAVITLPTRAAVLGLSHTPLRILTIRHGNGTKPHAPTPSNPDGLRSSFDRLHAPRPHGPYRVFSKLRTHSYHLSIPRPHGPYQVSSKLRIHSYHSPAPRLHGPYQVFSKLRIPPYRPSTPRFARALSSLLEPDPPSPSPAHPLRARAHLNPKPPSRAAVITLPTRAAVMGLSHTPLRILIPNPPFQISGGLRSSFDPTHAPYQIFSKLLSPPPHSLSRLLISDGLSSSAPTPHIHALYRISCGLRSSFDALYKIPDELSSSALTPHIHAFYQISGGLRSSFDHAHALYQISGGLSSSAPTPHIHALYQISGGLRSSFDHTHLHSEVLVGCSAMLVDTVVHLRAHTPPHPCPCEHPTHRAAPPTALLQPLAMLVSNIVEGHAPDNPGAKTRAPKPPPVKP